MVFYNPKNKNFKLLAVRVLLECAPWVRKCLAENMFYYLNNDYRISDDGTLIKRRSEFSAPISDDFFQVGEQGTPRINISAIVGKNGDGKSTLVEIIIRLLNNFAFEKTLGEKGRLKKTQGLCAELYYQLNDKFYKLEEKSSATNLYSYERGEDAQYAMSSQAMDEDEIKGTFFYTLVSNYSHYAYNTLEVDRDVEHGKDEEHWLHNVFHKNDGYQVPLSIHPYREKGIIDINNEVWLSKQRVLMTFVKSDASMEFNGKKAIELVLSDTGFSKLQEVTLKRFFTDNRGVRLLQKRIDAIKKPRFKPSDSEPNTLTYDTRERLEDIVNSLGNASYELIDGFRMTPEFYIKAKKWIDANGIQDSNPDLEELMSLWDKSFNLMPDPLIHNNWSLYSSLSWIQIQRIMLLEKICTLWRTEGIQTKEGTIKIDVSPDLIFKPYEDLTDGEKCLHYMIYKTISIFETYSSYGNPCEQYSSRAFWFEGGGPEWKTTKDSVTGETITFAFGKLARDWDEKSHITLKLRQAYNYYKNDYIRTAYGCAAELNEAADSRIHISLDNLRQEQKVALKNYETLPPPIFYWDLSFSASYGKETVSMATFSSGEKQKLYCQSAIIYHLQNISSIGTEKIHYHAVNLFLEETELYFHPDWQRSFCYELMEMIRAASIKDIQSVNITFVTHSPYILSDIPKTNVLFLKDGRPNYSMQENTFGANINTLLKNGFFLPGLPIGEFARRKIDVMFTKLQSGDFDKKRIDELQSEVMMVGEPYIRQQLMSLIKMRPDAQSDISSLIQYVQSLQSELTAVHYRIEEIEKVQISLSNRGLNKLMHD